MKPMLKLLSPVPLVTMSGAGLVFLAGWAGYKMGAPRLMILAIILAIVVIWALVMWIIKLREAKAGTALEKSIEAQAQKQMASARPGREKEIEQLRNQLLEAIRALKSSRVGKGKKGASSLYVLPWYMIIGPPAAGKTTLLQNSGLNFPYLDPARSRSSVRGVGGTRNCDWWFADEAVILDTAGRYVLPVEADDTQEWLGFLELLRKHRGRKPINGLLVGVAVPDLLAGGEAGIEDHAQKIRNRIDELIQQLRVTVPVYVVFTKCDLVRGFVEFFGDLSRAERAQAWGATLARDRAMSQPAERVFNEEMDRLVEALSQAKVGRLAQVNRREARPEVLFFPLQFAALQSSLSRFLGALFRANPYQEQPIFRGFYFTSGTQEGRPIDSVIHAMLRDYGVQAEGAATAPEPSQTKSYFIEDVFSRIAFPDRHLAGPSARGERRRRAQRVKTFTAALVTTALAFILLASLYTSNSALVKETRSLSDRALGALSVRPRALPLDDLQILERLRGALVRMDARHRPWRKLLFLGTYQGEKMAQEARRAALTVLRERSLNPALSVLGERLLTTDVGGETDFRRYFRWYRTWLLIQDASEYLRTPADADDAAAALSDVWQSTDPSGDRAIYERLMSEQLADGSRHPALLAEVFPAARADAGTREAAAAKLRQGWSMSGVYPSLLASAPNVAPITLVSVLGGDVGLVGSGQVPGVFTRAAWNGPVGEFLAWVRRIESDPAMAQAFGGRPAGLESELMRRYAGEYEEAWARFFASVQVKPGVSDADAQVFLDRAAGESSPVLKLLRAAHDNARFGPDAPGDLRAVEDHFALLGEFLDPPGRDAVFRKVKQWVGRSGSPGKEYLQLVKDLSGAYSDVVKASDPGRAKQVLDLESWIATHIPADTPIAAEMGRVLRLPIQAVTKKVQAQAGAALESKWGNVYQEYAQNLAGRYPLVRGAAETVALPDFEAFFSPAGTFWRYYQENLAGVITEDGARVLDPSAAISPAFQAALRSAYRIRRAFFPVGERAGFSLSLSTMPPTRPEGVSFFQSRLEVGGASLLYRSGPPSPREVSWPGQNPGAGASLSLDLRESAHARPLAADGHWGFFRLLDRASVSGSGAAVKIRWTLPTEKGDVQVEYTATGLPAIHPLEPGILRFELPRSIAGGP